MNYYSNQMSEICVFGAMPHKSSFMKRIMGVIKTNTVLTLGSPFLWVFVCFLVSSSHGGYVLELNLQSTFWQDKTAGQNEINT